MQLISGAECAVLFWHNRLPAGEMLGWVDHMGGRDVARAHQGFTSLARNVEKISVNEVVYRNSFLESGPKRVL